MAWYFWLAIVVFVGTFFFGIKTILKYSKKEKLSDDKKEIYEKRLKNIINNHLSSKERIIECDKLYHKILLELGYKGTFGEILKKEPNEVGDLDKVWKLHKLRNKLVHDFDLISENTLKKNFIEYKKEIKHLF